MDITVTPAAMQALEADFMQTRHVPSALLMEHAAQGLCAALSKYTANGCVLFLCGPGNNGGDGYAAARLWVSQGGSALIWELAPAAGEAAAMNRALAVACGVSVTTLESCPAQLPPCDAVVDALFGTGLNREITGIAAVLIDLVNRSAIPVIAADVPSGLDGLTGRVHGHAVRACETVTFHRIKQGLVLLDGPRHAGRITVQPILIPPQFGSQDGLRCMTPGDLQLIPPRSVDAHKGTLGRVVLLVGSQGMAGAAAFCANACLQAGAGLVQILCRAAVLPVVQTLAPGATCIALPEENGRLSPAAPSLVASALRQANAGAVGCGLGQADDLLPLLRVFREASCPVVWDADALNILARHHELLPLAPSSIITPHPGEAARLLGVSSDEPADLQADPLEQLQRLQHISGCTVVFKGARTLMTDGVYSAVNRYATPALAKGGSGDVLTGIMAALLARRLPLSTLEIAQLAVLVHGLAGIRAEKQSGENGVTPTLLIHHIRLDTQGL